MLIHAETKTKATINTDDVDYVLDNLPSVVVSHTYNNTHAKTISYNPVSGSFIVIQNQSAFYNGTNKEDAVGVYNQLEPKE